MKARTRTVSTGAYSLIFTGQTSSPFQRNYFFRLYHSNAALSNRTGFGLEGTDDTLYESVSATLNLNTWYHYVGTFEASTKTLRLYRDGTLVDSDIATNWNGFNDTNIEATIGTTLAGANFFNGTIDEVMIFNRTLSPEQVYNLYTNRTKEMASNETSAGNNWTA